MHSKTHDFPKRRTMERLLAMYEHYEDQILQSLNNNGIEHRIHANSGLWLGALVGFSAAVTLLREDNSYSEICLVTGVTGFGLVICSICLYLRLAMDKTTAKDFQVVYFLPAIITSMLYLYIVNKGLLISVIWGLSVGSLGTWGVLQVMSMFPKCFTIGEATAALHAFILLLMSAVANLPLRSHLPPIHSNDITTVILQVGILYVIALWLLCGYYPAIRQPRYFYSLIIAHLVCEIFPILYLILDQNPVTWVLHFVFGNSSKMLLFAYWAGCLCVCALFTIYYTSRNVEATTATRKSFHLSAVFVYIPGLIFDPELLYLASGVIFVLFLLLELMRFFKIPPLGEALQKSFSLFADEKDVLVSLTPLYLLCGLSMPLWMPRMNMSLLPLLSGVLTVGIGDTAASFVGSKWGAHKWPSSNKSVEGTLACILSQVSLIVGLACMGYLNRNWLLIRSLLASVAVSFIEARTNQIDNLALPLLMYTCLII